MARFTGHAFPDGLLVLDTITGEIVFAPRDGSPSRVVRGSLGGEPVIAQPVEPLPLPPKVVEPEKWSGLAGLVVRSFPHPIASAHRRFLEERDPREKCKLLYETFTAVVKSWALQLIAEYLQASGVNDVSVNEAIARDLQRPLISVWGMTAQKTLACFRASRVTPFSPELRTAFEVLETKCRDPFLATVRFEDESGVARTRTSKLGKISALVKFRNSLAHGGAHTVDQAKEDLALYAPVLDSILEESKWMTNYPLFALAEPPRPGEPVLAYRLMGDEIPREPLIVDGVVGEMVTAPVFLRSAKSGAVLPLPVVFDWGGREGAPEPLLFDGNTKTTVIYVATSGGRVERQAAMQRWRELLSVKSAAGRAIARDDIAIDDLATAARRVTDDAIDSFVSTGRYLREVTVWRAEIDRVFAQFELGDYRGLVVAGEGGIGKSTILARHVEDRLGAGDVVLFYRASTLGDVPLGDRVRRDLGVAVPFFEDLLAALHGPFTAAGNRKLRIVIDGVNEHPDPAMLIAAIDAMVRQAESYPWLRFAVSVRTSSYARLPPDARFGRLPRTRYLLGEERHGAETVKTPLVNIPLLEASEAADVYERYRAYVKRDAQDPDDPGTHPYRPTTPIGDLDRLGSTMSLLRNPLLMRLILAAFRGRELPSQLAYDEAMALYVAEVVAERGARPDRVAFLRSLVREFDARGVSMILRDELYDVPRLASAMRELDRKSPYVQLVELGVLVESWSDDAAFVRVAFDRLFEYLLAQQHAGLADSLDAFVDAARRARNFPNLAGALSFIALQACREQRFELFAGILDRSSANDDAGPVVEAMAVTVLDHLVRARFAHLERLLSTMLRVPTAPDVRVLLQVFDHALHAGEPAGAELVARVACDEADALGDDELRASALFRVGMLHQHAGRLAEAESTYARARAIAVEAKLEVLEHRINVVRGEVMRLRGDSAGALELFAAAADALHSAGMLADAAEARRQQAIALGGRGMLPKRAELLTAALATARESGDALVETRCLISVGVTAWLRGEAEPAERSYREALARAESIGHLRSIGIASCNLGNVLCRDRGALDDAREAYARYLATSERLGDRLGVATALHNLAIVDRMRGDFAGAELRYARALQEMEALGDKSGLPSTLNGLALAMRPIGKRDEAVAHHERALALSRELDDRSGEEESLFLLADVDLDENNLESALQRIERLRALDDASNKREMHVAALEVRVATRGDDINAVREKLSRLRETLVSAGELELEDGPFEAWLDAAGMFARVGERADAKHALDEAIRTLRDRAHDRAEELATLKGQLGGE